MSNYLASDLVLASEGGDAERVLSLLEQGASPDAKNKNSHALHSAVVLGHKNVVAVLLEQGANPNLQDKQQFYPLHLAASEGHTAICNLLLKAKAQKDVKNKLGATALHIAATANHAATLVALVKGGCDKDHGDADGNTPLSIAAALGSIGVVKSLIKAGATVNTTNNKGDSPLMQALWTLYDARIANWSYEREVDGTVHRYEITKGCFRLIENYVAYKKQVGKLLSLKAQRKIVNEPWGPSEHAKYLDAIEIVKQLLRAGANPNIKNKRKITPLGIACYAGVGRVIKVLSQHGARFEAQAWNQITQLHQVAGSGRLDGLEMFLKFAGSKDINALDPYGWTPAHYLADTGGPIEMAKLLVKHGVDTTMRSTKATNTFKAGITATQIALHWDDMDLAGALT